MENKNLLKNSFLATFMCLVGCSIGSMGFGLLFRNYSQWETFVGGFVSGFISCFVFMVIWNLFYRKLQFKKSIKLSLKMSFVSIFIMVATENLLIYLIFKDKLHHLHHAGNGKTIFIMGLGMFLGFIFCLPYNYYQLKKKGRLCH